MCNKLVTRTSISDVVIDSGGLLHHNTSVVHMITHPLACNQVTLVTVVHTWLQHRLTLSLTTEELLSLH